MNENIIIGVNGSTDIDFGRKTLEFGVFSKKTKTFNVSNKVFKAIIDAYNGDLDNKKAYDTVSKEIDEFYLDGIIILNEQQKKLTTKELETKKQPVKTQPKPKLINKSQKKAIRKLPLNRDTPIKVPFNVNLNDGTEGECVKRVIKPKKNSVYPGQPKREYTGKTVEDLIKYCDETKRSVKLYDITGKVFYKADHAPKKNYPAITALVHDQHIYNCETKNIKINGEVCYEQPEEGYVYYKRGNYVITSGIHKEKESEAYLETGLPVCSFDESVAELLKESVLALSYYADTKVVDEKYSIDCNKCYYTTATDPGYINRYGLFSIFDKFEPFSKQEINEYSFYQINAPESWKYGVTTNFIGGRTLLALRSLGVVVRILKVLNPSITANWEHGRIKELFDDHKKFNVYNGMCGKVECLFSTEIEIQDPQERQFLLEDHPDFVVSASNPNVISSITAFTKVNNYLHRYLTIVDAANARILRTLKDIGKECIKIKTDSLTFTSPVSVPVGWKAEEYKCSNTVSDTLIRKLKLNSKKYDRNICILGPPGTGKSYLVKNSYEYDYAAAYTNKSALNCSTDEIPGQTLHVLFNLMSTKSLCHLRDKTVWVDEISMIPRWIWGYIMEAYLNFNTTFIFSGDFNQTMPVGENTLYEIPFLGKINRLTKDFRNDSEIIKMREAILNDTFDINSVNYVRYDELPLCNIAYTNEKVSEVNSMIVKKYGFVWGDKGTKVIANTTVKKLGVAKNQSYILTGDLEILAEGKHRQISQEIFDKIFDWGYCYTVHKSQGDTIKEDLGIHEFKRYNKSIQYTAITRACSHTQLKFFE